MPIFSQDGSQLALEDQATHLPRRQLKDLRGLDSRIVAFVRRRRIIPLRTPVLPLFYFSKIILSANRNPPLARCAAGNAIRRCTWLRRPRWRRRRC
ncbi:hypothetical protein AVDCRST_MAG82-2262 [uncultured Rubrobacteraceae bacterium]|uniref:Uncharacterized protein n=1 Tax=uncultured Rubrobacteraceae bacterium TaxID=349277 RepID=A0A6J4Q653_9ACTN|nr:hypothetical protein AVDCRST_MAG82-2262 [uncultured Rubrobacteraceae bacterium]